MDSFPFTRQTSRDLLMSAEDKGRALKSSLTEGSSRLFGSVMDAKRGIVGGLSSTFDKAVSMVGGSDNQEQMQETSELPSTASPSESSHAVGGASEGRPARPPRPPTTRADSVSSNSSSSGKPRPPKPPAPMNRQRSDLDSNGSLKQLDSGKMSRQNTAPTGYGGAPSVPGARSDGPGRAKINPFTNEPPEGEYDWQQTAGGAHNPFSQSGSSYPQSAPDQPKRKTRPSKSAPDGGESDADSESTEGCDEGPDEDDFGLETSEYDGGIGQASMMKSGSKTSQQSWNEDENTTDPQSQECIEFMKYFVQKVFDGRAEIISSDKAKFGGYCQSHTGRLHFARCANAQSAINTKIPEETLLNLVQFFAIVLFECNESDDYGPAKTLMDICFTLYRQGSDDRRQYLYSLLRDQSIWQSQRFWNAAFFYTVQQERVRKAPSSRGEDAVNDQRFQENIVVDQLRSYSSNMRALGISKEHCWEFIRKQSATANIPQVQVKALRESVEHWREVS